ncbi:MAG TPA: DUF2283 domain-containing protein [Methanosarcina sp.]|nr:DUF2283 domain-containing protein [Methanosarcina sp.]
MTFHYDPYVDCAYFAIHKPVSTTLCQPVSDNVIVEFDATKTLVGVELLWLQHLSHVDLEPLKRFLSWETYLELLENVGKHKRDNVIVS